MQFLVPVMYPKQEQIPISFSIALRCSRIACPFYLFISSFNKYLLAAAIHSAIFKKEQKENWPVDYQHGSSSLPSFTKAYGQKRDTVPVTVSLLSS